MKFGHIELFVNNPGISKEFFVNVLNFELVSDQNPSTIWVKMNETELLLREGKGSKTLNYKESNVGLVIYTDKLLKSKEELEGRGLIFQGIDESDKCHVGGIESFQVVHAVVADTICVGDESAGAGKFAHEFKLCSSANFQHGRPGPGLSGKDCFERACGNQ